MLKTYLSFLVAGLLFLSAVSQPAAAQQDKQPMTEQIKIKIAKLGIGEKARATITMKDGTKTKGYVSRAGDDVFVMRDRRADAATTIRYADVLKAESNRGHSTARNIAIGVGIGVGAFLAAIAIILSHLD
jgi:putative cell wall-binding protein